MMRVGEAGKRETDNVVNSGTTEREKGQGKGKRESDVAFLVAKR